MDVGCEALGAGTSRSDRPLAAANGRKPHAGQPSGTVHVLDAVALESAMERWGDTVLRLATSRMGSVADAEDVFQTVFMRLLQSRERFTDDERAGLAAHVGAQVGDCIFFAAGPAKGARALLGAPTAELQRQAAGNQVGGDGAGFGRQRDGRDVGGVGGQLHEHAGQRDVTGVFEHRVFRQDERGLGCGHDSATSRGR